MNLNLSVENSAYVAELQVSNPTAGDPVGEGYEHINLVKGTLKNTFPNMNGQVTATPGHLNNPILATDRPPVPGANAPQVQTVPYYSSATAASTFPITDFGKSLLALADSSALSTTLSLTNYVKKSGDTMTGTLAAPRLEIAGTPVAITALGVQFGPNARIDFDSAQQCFNFVINGKNVMTLSATALTVRANIIRGVAE